MLSVCDFSCDFVIFLVILYVIFCDFKGGVRKKISELPLDIADPFKRDGAFFTGGNSAWQNS